MLKQFEEPQIFGNIWATKFPVASSSFERSRIQSLKLRNSNKKLP